MLERIKENPEKPDLLIRDAEWDSWVNQIDIKIVFIICYVFSFLCSFHGTKDSTF